MAKEIKDLKTFLTEFDSLLEVVEQCGPILFRKAFRKNLKKVLPDVRKQLKTKIGNSYLENNESMKKAGLSGDQLQLKLESFSCSLNDFEESGSEDDLKDALDKGGTLLNSLAGTIPGFGSFAQELIDFILKELKKRFRFGRK